MKAKKIKRETWRTATYHVEIRSLDAPVNTCDCPDFAKSGLGTCKHIERAFKTAARKCGSRRTSSTAEVFMGIDPHVPLFAAAVACYARGAGALDVDIVPVTMEDLVPVCENLQLSPEDVLVLQLAVQGIGMPEVPASAKRFCEKCRDMEP